MTRIEAVLPAPEGDFGGCDGTELLAGRGEVAAGTRQRVGGGGLP